MLKKHSILFIALLSSTHLYANVPIESRALSQQQANNVVAGSPSLNWEIMQKNQKLEEEIRKLRGQLEEHDNAIEQLKKELANRYTDLDQRLELLSQKIDPPEENTEENGATDTAQAGTEGTTPTPPPVAAVTPKPQAQTQVPAAVQPQTNTATTNTTNNQIELEKAAYTVALDAYKQGGAKKAIEPMQNFIKNYPNSIYTGNAYFWLAEFQLAIDPPNYNEAKKNYEIVAAKFPNSSKAPRALYQLYSIAKDVNKNTQTANVYKNKLLTTYPKSEEASYFKKA